MGLHKIQTPITLETLRARGYAYRYELESVGIEVESGPWITTVDGNMWVRVDTDATTFYELIEESHTPVENNWEENEGGDDREESLADRGYADYKELEEFGIKRSIDMGENAFGFREKIIETIDGTQWDYIPEDGIYEVRKGNYIK